MNNVTIKPAGVARISVVKLPRKVNGPHHKVRIKQSLFEIPTTLLISAVHQLSTFLLTPYAACNPQGLLLSPSPSNWYQVVEREERKRNTRPLQIPKASSDTNLQSLFKCVLMSFSKRSSMI